MLQQAIKLIDAANSQDPNFETVEGKDVQKELLYSQRMVDMLNRFQPGAEETAQLSVRAQHIERWKSPRSDFPMDRKGYHQWRTQLYTFHAETTAKLLQEAGYTSDIIERVSLAIAKKNIRTNDDTKLVEDVAALTFIEHYMLDFYQKFPQYDEDKWVDIILRTWKKMTPTAHEFALSGKLQLPESLVYLIQKAVAKA